VSVVIVDFVLNGERVNIRVMSPASLLEVLREELGLPGSKNACEQGECGSCSVILDDELVCACLVMAADVEDSTVVTVEGIGGEELSPVQRAMNEAGAVQCGFCTPGIVVAAEELFARNPHPSTAEIKEALAGNICRCTGYGAIIRAFERLAESR
jgi:carbon-monoxide dehydrogenase small subunit